MKAATALMKAKELLEEGMEFIQCLETKDTYVFVPEYIGVELITPGMYSIEVRKSDGKVSYLTFGSVPTEEEERYFKGAKEVRLPEINWRE